MQNAESYLVEINDASYTSTVNIFNVSSIMTESENNCYVRVKAVAEEGSTNTDSSWSTIFTFNYDSSTGNASTIDSNPENVKDSYTKHSRYVPEQVEGGMQFNHSVKYEDSLEFYYFYIGTISSAPIFTSDAKRYDFDGTEYTVKYGKATTETISNTISVATETIDTHSYTGGFEVGRTVGVEVGNEAIGKVKAEFSVSTDHHWTNNWGKTVTTTSENIESYSTSLNEEYEVNYIFSEEGGFIKGRSYREALYEVLDVFAIVAYDIVNDEYSFEFQTFIEGDSNRVFVTEESDEYGSFNNPTGEDRLNFDFDQAKTYIATLDGTENQVYSNETDAAHILGFDSGCGSITSPYVIAGKWKSSSEQFLLIENYLNSSFRLETDVDLSSFSATSYNAIIKGNFTGQLDGNGNTISGLNLDLTYQNIRPNEGSGYKYQIGLFEHIGGEELSTTVNIKNLIIDDFQINFDPYHENKDEAYAFGLLTATGSGIIENVTIQNSRLEVNRAQSTSGFFAGAFSGQINYSTVKDSYLMTNGDGGGFVGRNYGQIQYSNITSSTLYYYFVNHDNVAYEYSVGGISGTLQNLEGYPIATIESCTVSNIQFINHHDDNFGLFGSNHYSPKTGYIVGHAMSGRIYTVGMENCTKEKTAGASGDYYFKVGWGYAGKLNSDVDVK